MLKHVCATWAMCLLALLGFAQNSLSIRVLDNQKNPLAGANVTVNSANKLTADNGVATFDGLKNRNYSARVSFVGFIEKSVNFNPSQTNELTIILQPNTLLVEDVFVSATRAKENSATTFKNLNKEDIRKANLGQDIPYLLDQTPGVVIGSDAGAGIGYTNMTIRGSDNQRINVTLNGIPLNDAESMGSFFVNLPDFASSVESIQIQRGIGTSTNGAVAFGASLNIQTDALETSPYAELNNSFGSFNSWKNTIKAGTGLINGKYAFNTRLSRIASDGYVERASSDLKSFYVDGGLYTEKQTLKATVFSGKEKTYQAWYGTPEPLITGNKDEAIRYANEAFWLFSGPEYERLINGDRKYNYYTYDNQTDNYTQTHSHLHYTNHISEKFSLNTALHYTRGAGYYEEYREGDDFADYSLPNVTLGGEEVESTDIVRRRWLDNHFYGLTYALNYTPSNKLNFIVGGAYNQYDGKHYGEIIWAKHASTSNLGDKYYLNNADKKDFNIYGKADYKTDKWLLNLDLQYRRIHYEGQGPDDEILDDGSRRVLNFKDKLNFFNPKIGATYFINPQSNVYISYAHASKEPVRKDYVENPLNEFPRPEKMQDIEAGYRFKNERFNIGANAYAMLYKDQLIQTGALNDVGGTIRQNVEDSYRIGLELDGAWNITSKFTWKATAVVSENKIKNFKEFVTIDWDNNNLQEFNYDKTNIAMSASTIFSNDFTYRPVESLAFSLTSKYISRLYLDNTSATERSIDPSFVNNFRALYTVSLLGIERVDFNLAVNNIFDAKYQTNGYTFGTMASGERMYYNFYYPQAGTNFLLGLNIRF